MSALGTILRDNWNWRTQIGQLALFDLKKQSRGSVLGWVWFIIKPVVYIACFWFAIEIGLKAARTAPGDAPYVLWLSAGIIPWFFMRNMLSNGVDVMHRYPYLVNKVKFPISGISTIYTLSAMLTELITLSILVVMYIAFGQPLDLYLLQVPLMLLIMFVFWLFFSIFMSPLCVISKDVKHAMSALTTPFFWLSGVIFNVNSINIDWIKSLMAFNPITFFVTGFRDAVYDKVWFWEDPMLCAGFAVVFVATVAAAVFVYSRTNEEIVDVL